MKSIALTALLLTPVAFANTYDYSKKWGIGASYGYNTPVFGNTFNTAADADDTWGLHLRYHLNESTGLEAGFTKHEFEDTTSAIQVTDVTWFKRLKATDRLSPIFGAGAGVVDITNYAENNLKLGLKLRAGAEYALTQCLSLGLNIDYQHVDKMFFSDNLDIGNIEILSGRVGLTWYFGKTAAAAAAATTAVVAQVVDLDSDKDGISDKKDKCPGTAEGITVNAYGCAEKEKASVHLNVQFSSGKSTIASGYDADLKELAAFMSEHPTTKIEIQGHTDSSGSKAINKSLSQKRADSVKAYLVNELKVDESRVHAVGYGDEMPVSDNSTADGRSKNRRVIAVIE